jgi:organic radical activating enzyme
MKEKTFTSTGIKIIHHPELLRSLQGGYAYPISLQVAPTSKCNLNCSFCSNVNRDKNEDLSYKAIYDLLKNMRARGLKTVEWTGGGDPTLYPYINEVISVANSLGLQQGFITNGISLVNNISEFSFSYLKWIRISMNSLDYDKIVQIPFNHFSGVLGFSYVMNERTTEDILKKLHEYVIAFKPSYVRIVPNCQATDEQQKANNKKYSEQVESWGEPFFYQKKEFCKPERCWWGYIKPFVLHDNYVYHCSSVVLNDNADRQFHQKYRWCSVEELPKKYDKLIECYVPTGCDHCVFTRQNNLIDDILHPNDMVNFV